MPDSTPIYGFTYPCPDETITPSAFSTLANQIDTKLVDVNNDAIAAVTRRNVAYFDTTLQAVPSGVETVITTPRSTYVIPVAGIWVVTATVNAFAIPAAMNWARARLRLNAVFRAGFTQDAVANLVPLPIVPVMAVQAAAGDTVSLTVHWNGAGVFNLYAYLEAKMIVRIA